MMIEQRHLPTIHTTIRSWAINKAPGEDNIIGDILQDGGETMVQVLTDLFNTCLHYCWVPKAWKNALIVLIHKGGKIQQTPKNYRPISLLPIMYKAFSNILLQRMFRTLDFHQPREQAGFRAGYSTIDHQHIVNHCKRMLRSTSHFVLPLSIMKKSLTA